MAVVLYRDRRIHELRGRLLAANEHLGIIRLFCPPTTLIILCAMGVSAELPLSASLLT